MRVSRPRRSLSTNGFSRWPTFDRFPSSLRRKSSITTSPTHRSDVVLRLFFHCTGREARLLVLVRISDTHTLSLSLTISIFFVVEHKSRFCSMTKTHKRTAGRRARRLAYLLRTLSMQIASHNLLSSDATRSTVFHGSRDTGGACVSRRPMCT